MSILAEADTAKGTPEELATRKARLNHHLTAMKKACLNPHLTATRWARLSLHLTATGKARLNIHLTATGKAWLNLHLTATGKARLNLLLTAMKKTLLNLHLKGATKKARLNLFLTATRKAHLTATKKTQESKSVLAAVPGISFPRRFVCDIGSTVAITELLPERGTSASTTAINVRLIVWASRSRQSNPSPRRNVPKIRTKAKN